MSYAVKILKDSIGPSGKRLTTFELTYPRFVHAELMTHRLLSRNSASSRAIPIEKMIERVVRDPVLPKWWGKNQKGMQAPEELGANERAESERVWLEGRDSAVARVWELSKLGLHKQIANRILEPWMFITVIASATEWENWYHLRRDPQAQPEIKWVAEEMWSEHQKNEPRKMSAGEWHLPLVDLETQEDVHRNLPVAAAIASLVKICVGRCARVSYLTHDGRRDWREDMALHDRLAASGHWSPFEHAAQALESSDRSGNYFGWQQWRKSFADEHYGSHME